MKFLAKLDPMTVLLLVVIFGVVITMSTQASPRAATQVSVDDANTQTQMTPLKATSLATAKTPSGKS
ncbi:MAG TPA: hypothetical protein ENI97_15620 [Gammaproteobacteria bacterium]|nr:hypothetical protein [Gammaproteobacteria bacterium]